MILFFGPSGSGKSVQGQLLVERNKWQWLSTGDLFRNSKDPEVLERLSTGDLIDDELTNKVLAQALESVEPNTEVVLDGYPRNLHQVHWLNNYLLERDADIACAILFSVPREELIRRLSDRGRTDDTPEVVNHRFDIYNEKTKPILDYYRENGVPVLEIDGVGDISDVHERIQAAVAQCLAHR